MQNNLSEQLLYHYLGSVILVYSALILFVVLAWGFVFLTTHSNGRGLQGVWRNPQNPQHTFQFRSNGEVDEQFNGKSLDGYITWERHGNHVMVRCHRSSEDWDYDGQLEGQEIVGKATMRGEAGEHIYSHDEVWRRDWVETYDRKLDRLTLSRSPSLDGQPLIG